MDFLPADLLADMKAQALALFTDPEVRDTVTWHYQSAAASATNAWTGKTQQTDTEESVSMIRASFRDSQSDEIVVGRYWYMGPSELFTLGTPDTGDVVEDEGGFYIVNAVRRDPFGLFHRFDVTSTTAAPEV